MSRISVIVWLLLAVPAFAQNGKAMLRITLPSADTKLEIQGQVLPSRNSDIRVFESPPLEPGKTYVYDVKATWTKAGKAMTRERSIKVRAGQTSELDLRLEVDNSPDIVQPKPPEKPPEKPPAKPPMVPPKEPPPIKAPEKPITTSFVAPPAEVVDFMLTFAKVTDKDVVYDLGSGDGRIALAAAGKFKAKKAVGIEHNPDRVAEAKKSATAVKSKAEFKQADWTAASEKDLADATVVVIGVCTEQQLAKLAPALKKLKPGTRIVVRGFEIPGLKFDEERVVGKDDNSIYLYTIK